MKNKRVNMTEKAPLGSFTHLSCMEFLTLINWTSPHPFLGLLCGMLYVYLNFNRYFFKRSLASDSVCALLADVPLQGRYIIWRLKAT